MPDDVHEHAHDDAGTKVLRWRVDAPPGTGPFPWALGVHGYSSHGGWGFWPVLAGRLVARGLAAVRVTLSGSALAGDGRTLARPGVFARNTYVDELADLAHVRGWVDGGGDRRLDPVRAGLVGHSRGAGMGLVHAAEDGRYRGVVSWAGMDSILRFSPERLARWRRQGFLEVRHFASGGWARLDVSVLESAERHRDRLDILAACGRLRCPGLVVVGRRDRSVPPEAGARMVRAWGPAGARLQVVDGDHVFAARAAMASIPPVLDQVLDATTGFLVGVL